MNARLIAIVSSVVLFHLAALWALHTGLLRRMVDVVVPVMLVSEATLPTPPAPPPPVVKPPEPPPPPPKATTPPRSEEHTSELQSH